MNQSKKIDLDNVMCRPKYKSIKSAVVFVCVEYFRDAFFHLELKCIIHEASILYTGRVYLWVKGITGIFGKQDA